MTFDPKSAEFGNRYLIDKLSRESFDPLPEEGGEDHEAHAAGKDCDRCHKQIAAGEDVRRTASGAWVHEECPA